MLIVFFDESCKLLSDFFCFEMKGKEKKGKERNSSFKDLTKRNNVNDTIDFQYFK